MDGSWNIPINVQIESDDDWEEIDVVENSERNEQMVSEGSTISLSSQHRKIFHLREQVSKLKRYLSKVDIYRKNN